VSAASDDHHLNGADVKGKDGGATVASYRSNGRNEFLRKARDLAGSEMPRQRAWAIRTLAARAEMQL
jgi:hypothetical protein